MKNFNPFGDSEDFPYTYNDFLNCPRPLHIEELERITIDETMRLLVVQLKQAELRWEKRFLDLQTRIDKYVTDDDLLMKLLNEDE